VTRSISPALSVALVSGPLCPHLFISVDSAP